MSLFASSLLRRFHGHQFRKGDHAEASAFHLRQNRAEDCDRAPSSRAVIVQYDNRAWFDSPQHVTFYEPGGRDLGIEGIDRAEGTTVPVPVDNR